MAFNSLIFIFIFLPIALLLYIFIPVQLVKNIVLLIMSLLFFAWDNPFSIFILLLMIAWNYLSGIELQFTSKKSKKISLIITVVVNVLILSLFKYTNFVLGTSMTLKVPLGLSFFTFSALSYIFDVYYGKCEAQYNPLHLALYIAFFGKVSMGPIVLYHDMNDQLNNHPFNLKLFRKGMTRFMKGLFKKVLLADQLSQMYALLNGNTTLMGNWLLAITFMLQLYFDFSGYSDMAIGIGNSFGFDWKENFDHPYTAISVQDFWRRWHISLSTWFRDYIYIPLGGSRVEEKIYIRNIMIVWLVTGIWHGANWTYIIWGLYYGVLNILEKKYFKPYISKSRIIGHIYTLLIVLIGWVFFMSPSIGSAFSVLFHMIGFGSGFVDANALFILTSNLPIFIISIIFCTNIYSWIERFVTIQFKDIGVFCLSLVYFLLFFVSITLILGSTFQSFLYSAF